MEKDGRNFLMSMSYASSSYSYLGKYVTSLDWDQLGKNNQADSCIKMKMVKNMLKSNVRTPPTIVPIVADPFRFRAT